MTTTPAATAIATLGLTRGRSFDVARCRVRGNKSTTVPMLAPTEREPDCRRQVRLEARQLVGRESDVADANQVVHVRGLDLHADERGEALGQARQLRAAARRDDSE